MLCYTIACKYWLFHFQTKLIDYEKNKDWRMAIDPIHESNNWFVKNHHKWGNDVFLLKFFSGLTLFQSIVYWIMYFVPQSDIAIADGWLYLSYFIVLLFGLYAVCRIKMESFRDSLGILKEMKVVGWFSLIVIATSSVASFVFWTYFEDSYYQVLIFYLFTIPPMGYMFIAIPYSKKLFEEYNYIARARHGNKSINKNNWGCCQGERQRDDYKTNINNINNNNNNTGNKGKEMVNRSSETQDSYDYPSKITHWKQVVGEYKGFVAFMNHLAKEFSTENLLFIQEVKLYYTLLYI